MRRAGPRVGQERAGAAGRGGHVVLGPVQAGGHPSMGIPCYGLVCHNFVLGLVVVLGPVQAGGAGMDASGRGRDLFKQVGHLLWLGGRTAWFVVAWWSSLDLLKQMGHVYAWVCCGGRRRVSWGCCRWGAAAPRQCLDQLTNLGAPCATRTPRPNLQPAHHARGHATRPRGESFRLPLLCPHSHYVDHCETNLLSRFAFMRAK